MRTAQRKVAAPPQGRDDSEAGQARVCLVGGNIRHTPGGAGRVFGALNGITMMMISQGASRLNLSLVVAEQDLAQAVGGLHHEFFTRLDESVFEAAV